MSTATSKPIASASFYGENRSQLTENNDPLPAPEPILPPYLSDPLLGPSKVWKIFRKQAEALSLISSLRLSGHLLPFSYESVNFERLFLVAHPDVFWYRDCQKKPHLRNTYEIIASDALSKLYFDLEFDRTLAGNKAADGNEMTRTLIRVVLYYIHKLFHVKYKMKDVLILDSSTATKFSVHLVFQIPLVFRTNIDAGHFVKYVCGEMSNIDRVCSDEEQLRFDIFKETTINVYAIKDLFVVNSKQVRVLFADLGVYTKNRLFRLYRSTKQGRQSPLVLSPINKFSPPIPASDPVQYDRQIFLSSLVTYFLHPPSEELIKEFEKPLINPQYSSEVNLRKLEKLHSGQRSPTKTSPYPALDDYIRTRVKPHGNIYRNVHFPSTNITVYDIKGYRYCGNIGRWHRSQNIKLIADVNRGVYYQKCHDVECAEYKSQEWPLPPEILFKIQSDEGDSLFEAVELEELLKEEPCIKEGNVSEPTCIEEGKMSDAPCIEEGKMSVAPCIEEGKMSDAPFIEEGKMSDAPCIEEGMMSEPTCIEEGKMSDAPCIEEGKMSDAPCIEEGKISDAPCIEEGKISDAPCIEEGMMSDAPCIKKRKVSDIPSSERTGVESGSMGKSVSETPCLEDNKDGLYELVKDSCLNAEQKKHLNEPHCIGDNSKDVYEASFKQGNIKTENKCNVIISSKELARTIDLAMEVCDSSVGNQINNIKAEANCDRIEPSSYAKCSDQSILEFQNIKKDVSRRNKQSDFSKEQVQSDDVRQSNEEIRSEPMFNKSEQDLGVQLDPKSSTNRSTYTSSTKISEAVFRNNLCTNTHENIPNFNAKQTGIPSDAQTIAPHLDAQKNLESSCAQESVLHSKSHNNLVNTNAQEKSLDSNVQKSILFTRAKQCESKVLSYSIPNISDREMVLNYVRNYEERIMLDSSRRTSRETPHSKPPCEPAGKKIKFSETVRRS